MPVTDASQPPARPALPELPELPGFVQIEPVGQCNLRCRMCPVQFREDGGPGRPPAFMPLAVFERLLLQCTGITELQLQGLGEPLLHPQFFDMVAFAARRGIRVSTNTNLTIMTPQQAARCIDSGLDTLHVSLDGADAASYEAIRLGARFERVLRNLRRVQQARAQAASDLPHVRMVAVLMRANLEQLPALVRLAAAEGIESLSVQYLCHDFGEADLPQRYRPMRTFIDEQRLLQADAEPVRTWFDRARMAADACGLPLRLPDAQAVTAAGAAAADPVAPARPAAPVMPSAAAAAAAATPDKPGARAGCTWPWRGAYFAYDGRAMPCCMVATPDRINFGNAAQEGVAAIWSNDASRAFRRRLASDDPPQICRSCALYAGAF